MPSEIFDITTGKSISIGKSWKRKNGVHPKDYLFPLMIPSDTLYCTDSSSWPATTTSTTTITTTTTPTTTTTTPPTTTTTTPLTTTTTRQIGDPAILVLAQQPILFNPATGLIRGDSMIWDFMAGVDK